MAKDPWEMIEEYEGAAIFTITERLPVPGGWLYRTIVITVGQDASTAMTFVPFARYKPGDHEARDKGEYDPASIRGGLGT